jgi:hypothetical protein
VQADEGERLREIAIAAKSYWGYDLDRVKEWAALGDFSPVGLRQKDVYVAEFEGTAGASTGAPRTNYLQINIFGVGSPRQRVPA